MSSLKPVDRSTFTPFNPGLVLDPNNFMAAIAIILDYINFGNSRVEVVEVRDLAQAWCKEYFNTPLFARHELDTVLEHHPNMFNFALMSRARLDPLPPEDVAMDVDGFPAYCEPSLFDDHVIHQLVDVVAARQAHLQQLHGASDHYAHVLPQVSAASLKETRIIWNIPGVMASLARLNIAALDDGTGYPMFVDPPGPTAEDGSMDAGAASTGRASGCRSEMSLDNSSGSCSMSLDRPFDDGPELSDDSFQTADSGGTFHTARTSSWAGLAAPAGDDSRMDTVVEDAAAEQGPAGEAMEGVLRGYFGMIKRRIGEARLRMMNAGDEDMS
ncbi:hypothetical protein J3458_003624 [Metarhizium acridum]|nr:hypothetical protein J3458_003624 [Metarhizium acridum]